MVINVLEMMFKFACFLCCFIVAYEGDQTCITESLCDTPCDRFSFPVICDPGSLIKHLCQIIKQIL